MSTVKQPVLSVRAQRILNREFPGPVEECPSRDEVRAALDVKGFQWLWGLKGVGRLTVIEIADWCGYPVPEGVRKHTDVNDCLRQGLVWHDELLATREALLRLYKATEAYFEHHGAEHETGCPEDDTCECPLVNAVNEAFAAALPLIEKLEKTP